LGSILPWFAGEVPATLLIYGSLCFFKPLCWPDEMADAEGIALW